MIQIHVIIDYGVLCIVCVFSFYFASVILEKLVRVVPLALLEQHDVLRKALECMDPLSLGTATHLLVALNPLLKMNMALKDSLMIILRKMLFSRLVPLI